jgi:hypothetical protein
MSLFSGTPRPVLGLTNWHLGALYPRVKRLKREAENSLPSSAEIKKAYTLSYIFAVFL